MTASPLRHTCAPRRVVRALVLGLAVLSQAAVASAQVERMYFPAVDNVRALLVQRINAEQVRIDMSAWYLTDGEVVNALLRRQADGLPIRLLGDRGSIFEIDLHTKNAFYRLANAGVPIRLRVHPTWYPEIDHWKATIFVGQKVVTFGSANYTPFELAPASATNYKDETVLFTDDAALVAAFKMKFDKMWNDTTGEPQSLVPAGPYFMDWDDACARESACSDFATLYPNPAPMNINRARLEPDAPLPADMVWGQGSEFNNRLVQEINAENERIDFVIYRLTVDNITEALLAKQKSGVPIRIILEPNEYLNKKWPEFWVTHANMDKLWAAGVQMKRRAHQGLTHMKMLITSRVATNGSSNLAASWQRDHNYFVPADRKPHLYDAMRERFEIMWDHPTDFVDFVPQPPDTPSLRSPANGATNVAADTPLTWNRAAFAVSYDVYLGTTSGNMTKVGNVPAALVNDPPQTYSYTPAGLQANTTYYWKVVALTNASAVLPSAVAHSATRTFTSGGTSGAPAKPSNPSPAHGAMNVSVTPTLTWSSAPAGTTYNVAFGTTTSPPQVATGLASSSYTPPALSPSTQYYWRVTAVSSGGTAVSNLWSFTTGSSAPPPTASEVVLYASDVSTRAGGWTLVNDASAAGGKLIRHPDGGYANTSNALSNPTHYFEAQFQAAANTRYRVWVRMRAKDDSKWNDSVFVQFSDSVSGSGNAVYRIGTTSSLTENLWTCGDCQTTNWGWSRHAYWLNATGDVWFQNDGPHTIRIQTREDGVDIDQIVISPATYLNNAPGPVSNDNTIVPKSGDPTPQPPSAPSSPTPANGASVGTSVSLSWSAAGATSYDVHLGTSNPPPLVSQNQSAASYNASGLTGGTTYYWRITAKNSAGSTTGPVWSFTTQSSAPTAPAVPGSPSPTNGETNVSTTPTLSWSSAGATSYDVYFGTSSTPPRVTQGQAAASYSPGTLGDNTRYYWRIVARNSAGTTSGPVWSFTTRGDVADASDIVIYASDVPSGSRHGAWSSANDSTSPEGIRLQTTDTGFAAANAPLASPTHYVDVTFNAAANVPYRIWLRLKALGDSKYNDAVWVQFSDARVNGSPVYGINTTSGLLVNLATDSNATSLNGWGWQNAAYWLNQATMVTFATTGTHTMRIQLREDGVMLDQIVLSPSTYLSKAPGAVTADATIVPKP